MKPIDGEEEWPFSNDLSCYETIVEDLEILSFRKIK